MEEAAKEGLGAFLGRAFLVLYLPGWCFLGPLIVLMIAEVESAARYAPRSELETLVLTVGMPSTLVAVGLMWRFRPEHIVTVLGGMAFPVLLMIAVHLGNSAWLPASTWSTVDTEVVDRRRVRRVPRHGDPFLVYELTVSLQDLPGGEATGEHVVLVQKEVWEATREGELFPLWYGVGRLGFGLARSDERMVNLAR